MLELGIWLFYCLLVFDCLVLPFDFVFAWWMVGLCLFCFGYFVRFLWVVEFVVTVL